MLSKPEKSQLKALVQSSQWSAFEHLMQMMIAKWKDDYGVRGSEWETLKNTMTTEGKVRGLSEFSQEIFNQIQSEG